MAEAFTGDAERRREQTRPWGPLRQTILVNQDNRAFGIERRGTRYCVGEIPHPNYTGVWLYRWDGYADGERDTITPIAGFADTADAETFRVWFTESEAAS